MLVIKQTTFVATVISRVVTVLLAIGTLAEPKSPSELRENEVFSHVRQVNYDEPAQPESFREHHSYPLFGETKGSKPAESRKTRPTSARESSRSPCMAEAPASATSPLTGIIEKDWTTLKSLSPVCTTDLPIFGTQSIRSASNRCLRRRRPAKGRSSSYRIFGGPKVPRGTSLVLNLGLALATRC